MGILWYFWKNISWWSDNKFWINDFFYGFCYTQCSSSATSTIASPQVSTASLSTRLIASPAPSRLSTRPLPVRILSPALTRYVCHTPSRTSTAVLMRTLTHSSDFFESTFTEDSLIEENIINSSYSSSYSSSSSVTAEQSFSETESILPNSPEYINLSTQRRKKITSKETYDLQKQLLAVENEWIEMIAELKKVSTTITKFNKRGTSF